MTHGPLCAIRGGVHYTPTWSTGLPHNQAIDQLMYASRVQRRVCEEREMDFFILPVVFVSFCSGTLRIMHDHESSTNTCSKIKTKALPGLEPGISCSVGTRLIHWATRPFEMSKWGIARNIKPRKFVLRSKPSLYRITT